MIEKIGGGEGPKFGNTEFDYQNEFVWDLKFHSLNNKDGKYVPWVILNDLEAIRRVIQEFGGVGYIIGSGKMVYDLDSSFKKWHQDLKGGPSRYTLKRIKRGAPSRVRKKSCEFTGIKLFFFDSINFLSRGQTEGWLKGFQGGFRNADGSPRREKVQIDIDKIPRNFIIT